MRHCVLHPMTRIDGPWQDITPSFDRPWRLEGLLKMMYVGDKMSTYEIADEFGCVDKTISDALERFGIERRQGKEMYHVRDGGVQHYFNQYGYEYVRTESNGRSKAVPVHRLVAVAHGADPHDLFSDEYVVHHENGHKFDNRPENIRVMGRAEHGALHNPPTTTNDANNP